MSAVSRQHNRSDKDFQKKTDSMPDWLADKMIGDYSTNKIQQRKTEISVLQQSKKERAMSALVKHYDKKFDFSEDDQKA